ncbi:hypothetical protein P7C70_g4114, partial [Phenoliferia sp. Uapishka_3]
MCTANSTLFYGIVVRLWTLVRAGRAWAALTGPTMALELLESRQQLGTLRTTSISNSIAKLPTEIWSMIMNELYAVALEDALATWLAEMRCTGCAKIGTRRLKKRSGEIPGGKRAYTLPLHEWSEWGYPECDLCMDNFNDVVSDMYYGGPGNNGLSLATEEPSSSDDREDVTIPICLPLRDRRERRPETHLYDDATVDAEVDHDIGNLRETQHAVISRDTFSAPLDDRPFIRLVKRYQLEVVAEEDLKIHGSPAPRYRSSSKRVGENAEPAMDGKAPQWRMWTNLFSCT